MLLLSAYAVSDFGRDDLCDAASLGKCNAIRFLLAMGANPSHVGWEDHFTPLGSAVWGGQIEAAQILLAHGADPNTLDNDKNTAIHSINCAFHHFEPGSPDNQEQVIALLRAAGGH